MDLSCGKCKLAKISYRKLRDKVWRERNGFKCVGKCTYMLQRFRAENSDVTLMTYQLWLHHMNLVNMKEDKDHSFPVRDVIFCDECHNIPDLVQQFCTPVIQEARDIKKIFDIINYAVDNNVYVSLIKDNLYEFTNARYLETAPSASGSFADIFNVDDITETVKIVLESLNIFKNNPDKVVSIIELFMNAIKPVLLIKESLEDKIKNEVLNVSGDSDKLLLSVARKLEWFTSFYSSINSYLTAVYESGIEYVLLEISEDYETKEHTYQLNCAKEDYLCNQYLLRHATNKVMLSATVGSHSSFDENIGTKFTKQQQSFMSRIPSTFNFDNSPVYYIPTYKMSFANKATDFPKIQQLCIKILLANSNKRGMIHTGSYENARLFYNNCPKELKSRLLLYGNSKQKDEIIPTYKASTNCVLVGPTLTEGIDLPGDLCRFIVIMKVPYPNITGMLVKKKIELFPAWYNNATSNIIIQSIGRGVRFEDDYCTTYILDGCFGGLYQQTKEQYPKYLQDRIKIISA